MRRSSGGVLAVGLLAIAGCYQYQVPGPPVPSTEVPIRASFGRTWDAVIDLFSEQNISIATIERASGIIVATPGYLRGSIEETLSYADCGRIGPEPYSATRVGYNIRVKGDSSRSTLRVNAVFQSVVLKDTYECTTKNVWENRIAAQIQRKAEQP